MSDVADHQQAALVASLMEIDRYAVARGWDQPVTLFALAPTAPLAQSEPDLAIQLNLNPEADAYALTPIVQDEFDPGADLVRSLAMLGWPDSVSGCALVCEQTLLPPEVEAELPADPVAAAQLAATHERRSEVRLIVGVHRDGSRHGIARFRAHEGELVGAPDLVPRLCELLAATLQPDEGA